MARRLSPDELPPDWLLLLGTAAELIDGAKDGVSTAQVDARVLRRLHDVVDRLLPKPNEVP